MQNIELKSFDRLLGIKLISYNAKIQLIAFPFLISILFTGCTTSNPYTGDMQIDKTPTSIGAVGSAEVSALVGGIKGEPLGAGVPDGTLGYKLDKQAEEIRLSLVGTGIEVDRIGNSIDITISADMMFKKNQSTIQTNFDPVLKTIVSILKKFNMNRIIISGYTDNVGSEEYNQLLSKNQTASIEKYLISNNITSNRITTNGRGNINPIDSNETAEGRSLNRRVVITLF